MTIKGAPAIGLKKAFAALSLPGARMMVMHTTDGDAYFIVPGPGKEKGGRVERTDAEQIMLRADLEKFDDGLFPGHEQSWRIVRHDGVR